MKEGKVTLQDGKTDGLLVPLVIQEGITSHFDHTGKEVEDRTLTGMFKIKNPSNRDRIWDIDVNLKDIGNTTIDGEKISLRELDPAAEQEAPYEINAKDLPTHLEVKEFVSALNDPDTESYLLVIGEDNQIYFKIALKNLADVALTDIEVSKVVNPSFSKVAVVGATNGKATQEEEGTLKWTVPQLDAGVEAALEFRLNARVEDVNTKVQSGDIKVS